MGKRDHLIRVDNDFAMYEEDQDSKRLSVIIPVQQPQAGSLSFAVPIKFMCLGSDVGGINRKPLKVIFTLEHGVNNVVARHAVDIRICSCPKRDKIQDEKKRTEDVKKINEVKTQRKKLLRTHNLNTFADPPKPPKDVPK